jgi:hypothetical protein
MSGFLRFTVLGLVLAGLFFASMVVFALVVGVLLVLGVMEWLRRKNILTEEAFSGAVEMPHALPEETVMETRIIEAEYTELGRPGSKP